jgi:hypothetical protein
MKPTHHVIISGGVSAVFGFWIQSWSAVFACFLSGIFIDLDHHLDYWLIKKEIPLSYKKLLHFCHQEPDARLYLFLHSYELIFIFWACIYYFEWNAVCLGVAVGVTAHIICDEIFNPMRPLAYFLTYRIKHGFERRSLLKKVSPSVILSAVCCLSLAVSGAVAGEAKPMKSFLPGETITYEIKKLKLVVGEAVLTVNGPAEAAGRESLWITFRAEGFQFLDEEQIYLDTATLHPLLIKRNLDIFGKEERIVEFYDEHTGRVRIVKTVKGETTEQVIENGERFDNIYGFIYRYRLFGQFDAQKRLELHLPTRDVEFAFGETAEFEAAGETYQACLLKSEPKKYEVWFDKGPKRIPLKINGAVGLGNTAMVMTGYKSGL